MRHYITPWMMDVVEMKLDALLCQLRVSASFDTYLKTYFQSLVTTIINEGKMKNASKRATTNQPPLVWVNTQLSDLDVDAFTQASPTDAEILQGLMALGESGYEIALKHDPEAGCHRAYLFNKLPSLSTHFGVSCFAATPRDTLHLLLFKFFHVMAGEWPDPEAAASKPKFG